MRIGLLSDPQLVNANYRSHEPLAVVARRGGHELVRDFRGQSLERALLSCARCWRTGSVSSEAVKCA